MFLGKIEEKMNLIISMLENVKQLEGKEEIEKKREELLNEIETLKNYWTDKQDKLSFFIEHNELEKVTKCLVVLEENYKNEEYADALKDGKEFIYWLNHFKDKDTLNLKNIF